MEAKGEDLVISRTRSVTSVYLANNPVTQLLLLSTKGTFLLYVLNSHISQELYTIVHW